MAVDLAQPDVTLLLDLSGTIREASVSKSLSGESVSEWLGCSWKDTVPESVADKIRSMMDDARTVGISAFRQLTQTFPSGREVPIEYTTVLLGGRAGLLAVGKSLLAVAELQSRFISAQQSLEREYWKLREVETRYQLLFKHSSEAVLLVRADNLRIADANPAAVQALGLHPSADAEVLDRDLAAFVTDAADWAAFRTMTRRVLEEGTSPGTLIHMGDQRKSWLARASSVQGGPGLCLLVQLVPTGPRADVAVAPSIEETMQRVPDGFVMVGRDGVIRQANRAFATMVDMGSVGTVLGERLERWIWRPGASVSNLLATLREHQVIRLFPTTLRGELGAEMDVEISGVGLPEHDPSSFGLLVRDVGRRLWRDQGSAQVNGFGHPAAEAMGKVPLRELVRSAVDGVERHYVKQALEQARGNRTAAAELLGMSRQALYMKLGRLGLGGDEPMLEHTDGSESM